MAQQQSGHVEHQREPCPDRIIDDIGGAFGMGAVGGGAWHLIKGMRNSPPGFRMLGAMEVRKAAAVCRGRRCSMCASVPSAGAAQHACSLR